MVMPSINERKARQIESLTYVVKVEEIVRSPMDGAVDELQPRAHVRLMQPIFQSYDRVEIVRVWHKPHASEDMAPGP